MVELQSVGDSSEAKSAPPTRKELAKEFSRMVLSNKVTTELLKQLSTSQSLGENSTLRKWSKSKSSLRIELRQGIVALRDASGDKRLETSVAIMRRLTEAEELDELVEWLFMEADQLAKEVGGRNAIVLSAIFGVDKGEAADLGAAENSIMALWMARNGGK